MQIGEISSTNNPATIAAIKARDYQLPVHWVQDWLLHTVLQPSSFLITDAHYHLTGAELTRFEAGIAQMQAGTPLAYLLGKQAFWSLEFIVNEHTLIPRPDTEVVVEQVLAWIAQQYQNNALFKNSLSNRYQLLDLGTGSGCIAISLAHELASTYAKQWQVMAVDFSAQALEVARQNAQLNQIGNIDFTQSDWFTALPRDLKYHVIVSNPPYIDPTDTHLDKLAAEPLSALVAEDKGLADIRLIIGEATDYLVAGGLLAIEHGYDQAGAVRQLFIDAGYSGVHTLQDYGGNDRLSMGQWG